MRLGLAGILLGLAACSGAVKKADSGNLTDYPSSQQVAREFAAYLRSNGKKDTVSYLGRTCWTKEEVFRENGFSVDLMLCDFETKGKVASHSNLTFLEIIAKENINSINAFDFDLIGEGTLCQLRENGSVVEEIHDEGCNYFYRSVLVNLKSRNLTGLRMPYSAEDSHKRF